MKILFFGTSEFAIPALKKLHESEYEIAGVITRPDKRAGRKQELSPTPVKEAALALGLKVYQPDEMDLEIPAADVFVVASYGKIIPAEIINLPKHGSLNIHPSLLPKYRGPSPIQTAILSGDRETGVTIIKLDREMDHGPLLAQRRIKNYELRIKYKQLHDLLAETGADLLMEILTKYLNGEIKLLPQDDTRATFTKIITKNDARIDWRKSAEEIDRLVRAYGGWPVAWTRLGAKRLKIYEADVHTSVRTSVRTPGEIAAALGRLFVNCGENQLEILALQLEGKQKMSAAEFLKGQRAIAGKRLR